MFSATGNLLRGSTERPDYLDDSHGTTYVCHLNGLGYFPVISTITGLGRAILGIVHMIVHIVLSIFDRQNSAQHLQEAFLGAKNFVRGLVEMVPFYGNMLVIFHDATRVMGSRLISKNLRKILDKENQGPEKLVHLSYEGKIFLSMPKSEFQTKVQRIHKGPSARIFDEICKLADPNKQVRTNDVYGLQSQENRTTIYSMIA